ncbi:hypothetical protein EA472_08595 [Natrarchaeobius oligotrophus]|uniref:Uncharacterized protein n=1 Tax=Natrarchaeobius chitinivorans TaxID=1679083 RepID=A0A3N6MSB4_NATCH|nr:hypothetical protein EA472_08595 [Natrarchaeobius chitinivorans]
MPTRPSRTGFDSEASRVALASVVRPFDTEISRNRRGGGVHFFKCCPESARMDAMDSHAHTLESTIDDRTTPLTEGVL